jgi:hypothetical protein
MGSWVLNDIMRRGWGVVSVGGGRFKGVALDFNAAEDHHALHHVRLHVHEFNESAISLLRAECQSLHFALVRKTPSSDLHLDSWLWDIRGGSPLACDGLTPPEWTNSPAHAPDRRKRCPRPGSTPIRTESSARFEARHYSSPILRALDASLRTEHPHL